MNGLCLFGELLSNKGEHHAQAEEPEEVEEGQAGIRPFFFFCTKRCKDPAYTSYNHGWLSSKVVVLGKQPMDFAAIASFCTTGAKGKEDTLIEEVSRKHNFVNAVNSLFLFNGTNNKWTIRKGKDFTFVLLAFHWSRAPCLVERREKQIWLKQLAAIVAHQVYESTWACSLVIDQGD